MPRAIDFKYICAETDLELTLIKVKIPRDFELIYKWMQQQHVIASWQLNESVAQLEK